MKKLLRLYLIPVCLVLGVTLSYSEEAAMHEEKSASAMQKFNSKNPLYAEADAVLNEAAMNIGDPAVSEVRIRRLSEMAEKYPDYKYRADLLYYVGLNAQLLRQYDKAAESFAAALAAEPGIAGETPIVAYLKAARHHELIRWTNIGLISLLALTMIPALIVLSRSVDSILPWGRLCALYAVVVALWSVSVYLLPPLFGAPQAGLELFPKPTLSNYRLGQIGDVPLRTLWIYGAGAILATLPVVAACSCLRRRNLRVVLLPAGTVLVIASVMGLYGLRHLFVQAQYNPSGHRMIFFTKSIDSPKDVPDEMIPLYEPDFAKRVLKARDGKEQ